MPRRRAPLQDETAAPVNGIFFAIVLIAFLVAAYGQVTWDGAGEAPIDVVVDVRNRKHLNRLQESLENLSAVRAVKRRQGPSSSASSSSATA